MEELYVIESGVRRRAEWRSCQHCSSLFLERLGKTRPRIYCGLECRGKGTSNKVEVTCAACLKTFKVTESRKAASKSGLLFCSRACKDETQKIGGIDEVLPSHYGKGLNRNADVYRRIYKETHNVKSLKCERCKYCEFECGVDIHHIDGDEMNNKPNNLRALCSPCHRALHKGLWK
jgi:hypothetical protein